MQLVTRLLVRSPVAPSCLSIPTHATLAIFVSISPGGIRTPDQGIMSPLHTSGKVDVFYDSAAQTTVLANLPADLREIVASWAEYSEAKRNAMLAIHNSAI